MAGDMSTSTPIKSGKVMRRHPWLRVGGMLLCTVLLALGLRWYRLPAAMGWWGDVASDHIMGEYIVRYGETPLVGHPATGLSPAFYYPPYYYYIAAAVKSVSDDPVFFARVTAALHALAVIPVAGIGTLLATPVVGLLAALLYACSFRLIDASRVTTPPYTLVPVLLFLLWGYVWAVRRRRTGLRFLLHMVLVVSSSWFYGVLILLPFVWVFDMVTLRTLRQRLISTLVFIGAGMLLFAPLMWHFGIGPVLRAFLVTDHARFAVTALVQFWKPLWITYSDLFWYDRQRSLLGLTTLTALLLFGWPPPVTFRKVFLVSGSILTYYVLFALGLGREPHDHDVHIVQPLLLLGMAGLIAAAWSRQRDVLGKTGTVLAAVFLGYLLFTPRLYLLHTGGYGGYVRLADTIVRDIGRDPTGTMAASFRISVVTPGEITNDHLAVWYGVERQLGRRMFRVVPDGFNLQELNPDRFRYVVCLRYDPGTAADQCLAKFSRQFGEYLLVRELPAGDVGQRIFLMERSVYD